MFVVVLKDDSVFVCDINLEKFCRASPYEIQNCALAAPIVNF